LEARSRSIQKNSEWMIKPRCPRRSRPLMPNDISELQLQDLIRILRRVGIYAELPPDSKYAVRFVASPYNSFHPDCRSIRIYAHNRGTSVSPLVIRQVLQ